MCHSKQNSLYLRCFLWCAIFGVVFSLPLANESRNDDLIYHAIIIPAQIPHRMSTGSAYGSAVEPHHQLSRKSDTLVDLSAAPHLLVKRASLSSTPLLDTPVDAEADDMELAEINVFRPLFRYRAAISRQVGQAQFG